MPTYNEMYDGDRNVRPHYDAFCNWLAETPRERIAQNRHAADLLFHRVASRSPCMEKRAEPSG